MTAPGVQETEPYAYPLAHCVQSYFADRIQGSGRGALEITNISTYLSPVEDLTSNLDYEQGYTESDVNPATLLTRAFESMGFHDQVYAVLSLSLAAGNQPENLFRQMQLNVDDLSFLPLEAIQDTIADYPVLADPQVYNPIFRQGLIRSVQEEIRYQTREPKWSDIQKSNTESARRFRKIYAEDQRFLTNLTQIQAPAAGISRK